MRFTRCARPAIVMVLASLLAFSMPACRSKGPVPAGAKSQQKASWQLLKPGMSAGEVRTALGEPVKINQGPAFTDWQYTQSPSAGIVTFAGGKLKNWKEPDW